MVLVGMNSRIVYRIKAVLLRLCLICVLMVTVRRIYSIVN